MIEIATIFEAAKFALDSWSWARKELNRKSEHATARIQHVINRRENLVRIHRIVERSPRVLVEGGLELSDAVKAAAAQRRPKLELNERHAIVQDWDGRPVDSIRVATCDFAEVLALREHAHAQGAEQPRVLSAGAVVICPSTRCVLLHRRSRQSATYPGALHILGGAYKPPEQFRFIDSPGDRSSLEFTMLREVFEESGLIVRRYQEPVCVMEELDTGFVQYVHLGVRVTREQFAQLSQNSEGDLIRLSFDELQTSLAEASDWVPTGRAQLLMWLGVGAPGAGWHARFSGKNAKQVFDDLVK